MTSGERLHVAQLVVERHLRCHPVLVTERIAIEERASLSPDALTGMEATLRFAGTETMETRIFGRLSAWQNWIFSRPNAVGDQGALKVFGSGSKARFDWKRV